MFIIWRFAKWQRCKWMKLFASIVLELKFCSVMNKKFLLSHCFLMFVRYNILALWNTSLIFSFQWELYFYSCLCYQILFGSEVVKAGLSVLFFLVFPFQRSVNNGEPLNIFTSGHKTKTGMTPSRRSLKNT